MSVDDDATVQTTAVSVRDSEANYRPLCRWGRGQYRFSKSDAIVPARDSLKISLAEFTSFMTTGTSPSRSPEKWKKFITVSNYGMARVKEGRYPYAMFDVEGFPAMKEVIIFIPIEPAAKLLPALYEEAKADPEKYGLKVDTAKTAESRAKHQARLDNLQWKPSDCTSSQNKSGVVKPTTPNPIVNSWVHVPASFQIKWCCTQTKASKSTASKKSGKRKDRDGDGDDLPGGVRVKTDVDFGNVTLLASVPVGSSFTTKVVDGVLHVVVYSNGGHTTVAEAEPDVYPDVEPEEAEDEGEEDDE